MRIIAAVVARTGSTRVPGKALLPLCGVPAVAHVINIAGHIRGVDEVVLATTTLEADAPLIALAAQLGVRALAGDPERVLDRLHDVVASTGADALVYVGADCPLLDPEIVSEALEAFRRLGCDYLHNYEPPTFPSGMDINIIGAAALATAYQLATAPSQRVHAFSYLTFHPEDFVIRNFVNETNLSSWQWAIDDSRDLPFVRAVYERLFRDGLPIRMGAVLELLQEDSDIRQLAHGIEKPVVSHAFLSSPNMMRDIHGDVRILIDAAQRALDADDPELAQSYYREIGCIVRLLGAGR